MSIVNLPSLQYLYEIASLLGCYRNLAHTKLLVFYLAIC